MAMDFSKHLGRVERRVTAGQGTRGGLQRGLGGRAAVACGEDATHAATAARRTTAFYTGDEVEKD